MHSLLNVRAALVALSITAAVFAGCERPTLLALSADCGVLPSAPTGYPPIVPTPPPPPHFSTPEASYAACGPGQPCPNTEECNLAFGAGQCTRRCVNANDCGWNGYCHQGLCLRRCAQGETVCFDHQAVCASISAASTDVRVCTPACNGARRSCRSGTTCNAIRGSCDAVVETSDTIGAPCNGRCSGICLVDTIWGAFPGGYCAGFAAMVSSYDPSREQRLPRGGCPAGSLLVPRVGDTAHDGAYCLRECVADGDCREGYRCRRSFPWITQIELLSGVCWPR